LADHPTNTSIINKKGKPGKLDKKQFIIAIWNVRTMIDKNSVPRPERRTALLFRELSRHKIDIAALSETRLADDGPITEPGGGYMFFWNGKSFD
jgi:hypothetical protein